LTTLGGTTGSRRGRGINLAAFSLRSAVACRRGQSNFPQSTLTRAVFYRTLLTATAFGSLWLSNHPGISSLGKLLAVSLACTLAAAALFQPALMGDPRRPGTPALAHDRECVLQIARQRGLSTAQY